MAIKSPTVSTPKGDKVIGYPAPGHSASADQQLVSSLASKPLKGYQEPPLKAADAIYVHIAGDDGLVRRLDEGALQKINGINDVVRKRWRTYAHTIRFAEGKSMAREIAQQYKIAADPLRKACQEHLPELLKMVPDALRKGGVIGEARRAKVVSASDASETRAHLDKLKVSTPAPEVEMLRTSIVPLLRKWTNDRCDETPLKNAIAKVNDKIREASDSGASDDFTLPYDDIKRQINKLTSGQISAKLFAGWWNEVIVENLGFGREFALEWAKRLKPGEMSALTPYTPESMDGCVKWKQVGMGYNFVFENGPHDYILRKGSEFPRYVAKTWVAGHPDAEISETLQQWEALQVKGIEGYAMGGGLYHFNELEENEKCPTMYVHVEMEDGDKRWITRSKLQEVLNPEPGDLSILKRMNEAMETFPERQRAIAHPERLDTITYNEKRRQPRIQAAPTSRTQSTAARLGSKFCVARDSASNRSSVQTSPSSRASSRARSEKGSVEVMDWTSTNEQGR